MLSIVTAGTISWARSVIAITRAQALSRSATTPRAGDRRQLTNDHPVAVGSPKSSDPPMAQLDRHAGVEGYAQRIDTTRYFFSRMPHVR